MRVDALHRRVIADAKLMHDAVRDVFPARMPEKYLSNKMNLKRFLDRLNTMSEPLGCFNEHLDDRAIPVGCGRISGLWIDKSELPENGSHADIRVIWSVHPDTKLINVTQAEWSRRYYYFWQIFMHELVHRHQLHGRPATADARTFKVRTTQRDLREEQEYLGNYDEIEAHSHDAALELTIWFPSLGFRDAIHEATTYNGRFLTPTYCTYAATFSESPNHPAMKHFRRKLKRWYDWMKTHRDFYDTIQLPNVA